MCQTDSLDQLLVYWRPSVILSLHKSCHSREELNFFSKFILRSFLSFRSNQTQLQVVLRILFLFYYYVNITKTIFVDRYSSCTRESMMKCVHFHTNTLLYISTVSLQITFNLAQFNNLTTHCERGVGNVDDFLDILGSATVFLNRSLMGSWRFFWLGDVDDSDFYQAYTTFGHFLEGWG